MSYNQSFSRIVNILNTLRSECPWDKKQTINTLRQLTIEEIYELADAISKNDWPGIKEELGDILLHIIFYAKIAEEKKEFTLGDVIESVCNKLVNRHPHIYTFLKVNDDKEVKQNWENIKLKEGKESILSGVPSALPAMVKALRLQEKSAQVGFEWRDIKDVKTKILEEIDELQEVINEKNHEEIEKEFGDVLFSLINYARYLNIDPEHALSLTNNKFKQRFELMEKKLTANNKQLTDYSLETMDSIWNEIKKNG